MKNVKYIDVGKMSTRKAFDEINKVRAVMGHPPVPPLSSWGGWLFVVSVGLLVASLCLSAW